MLVIGILAQRQQRMFYSGAVWDCSKTSGFIITLRDIERIGRPLGDHSSVEWSRYC